MKVLVLGAGRIGYGIAKALSLDEKFVSVIDHDPEALKIVSEKLDVQPVLGDACDINILKEAGIKDIDVLVAVTNSDEVNITACNIASYIFKTDIKIAKISKKSYFNNIDLFSKDNFSIDFLVSHEIEIANIIKDGISIPGALDVISCIENKLMLIGVSCKKNAPIVNVPLKYLPSIATNFEIALVYIKHLDGNFIMPGKNYMITEKDKVYFICSSSDIYSAMKLFGYEINDNFNNTLLIGGKDICLDLIDESFMKNLKLKIIEKDLKIAELLSEKMDNAEVIYGNSLNSETLESAGIRNTEVVISMTDDDKTNILSCLLAKKLGAQRAAAVLNDSSYSNLLYSLGINTILDSRQNIISKILHYIKKKGIENIISFEDDEIDIFSIDVLANSYAIGVLTDEITSKDEIYIAAIVREDKKFILPKKMLIKSGDKVIFIAKKSSIEKTLKMFQEIPKYLL